MDFQSVLSMIGTLALMVAVFAGAYWVSKFIGKKYQGGSATEGQIEIICRTPIGKGESIVIVKSAGKAFLIGVTEANITVLSELDPNDIPQSNISSKEQLSFLSVMQDAIKNRTSSKKEGGKN